jgi:hypothetical protein
VGIDPCTIVGVHNLQFTSYRLYGEETKLKGPEKYGRRKTKSKMRVFCSYKHHSLCKQEKREKEPSCLNFQWKRRGAIFTVNIHKNVKNGEKETEKETLASQLHKVFAKM